MLRKLIAFVLAFTLAVVPVAADQSSLFSPTTGTVSGLQLTENYNGALNALATSNSGSSAPTNAQGGVAVEGQWWLNTSGGGPTYNLEFYDGTQWEIVGSINTSTGSWTPSGSTSNPGFGTASNLASAATTDLGTITSHNVNVTGTTTVTSFGSSAATTAPIFLVTFSGSLTLTYNGTSLIRPGSQNITTAANDALIAKYLGSGNWQVLAYWPANSGSTSAVLGGATGVQITRPSTTTNTISAATAILVNSSGVGFRTTNVSVTPATGTAGANGLDTGSIAASTWYYLWLIYNGTTVAGLYSLSATAPTMPSGYTYKLYVGEAQTDASKNLIPTLQLGKAVQYLNGSGNQLGKGAGSSGYVIPVIDNGLLGSISVPTWVTEQVAGNGFFAPANAQRFLGAVYGFNASLIGAAPNNSYGAYNNPATAPPAVAYGPSGAVMTIPFDFNLESANIYAYSNGGSNVLFARGWISAAAVQ